MPTLRSWTRQTGWGRSWCSWSRTCKALCENVDDDFGWKLRGTLQSEPQIILLATATSRFERLDDAQEPFFELFRTVQLEPLNTEECRRLWQVVSGDTVSGREIRPLEILTGGKSPPVGHHCRVRAAPVSEAADGGAGHTDRRATEYFRGHLEVLPKSERRVYVAVLDLWRLSSPSEIAARARMDVRVVSTMLGRLVKRGAVRKAGHGRKQTYAAAEPLYSIYYKLRRERDESAVVENLILFMVAFYDPSECRVCTTSCGRRPGTRRSSTLELLAHLPGNRLLKT